MEIHENAKEQLLNSSIPVKNLSDSKPIFFSFGFRCSTASLLKKLELKHESYPFDWLISNLSVIQHAIQDNFVNFLDQSNYHRKYTNTYEMADSKNNFICDEHLMVNKYYQPPELEDVENTYKCYLAMNHHNILDTKDYEYYTRCVLRITNLLLSSSVKCYIHITHLITKNKYIEDIDLIHTECICFHTFMETVTTNIYGLFFIMVREDDIQHPHIEITYNRNNQTIYVLYANKHFIDAGECFMGHCYEEVDIMKKTIMQKYNELYYA